jgi:Rieske Fe-S protein
VAVGGLVAACGSGGDAAASSPAAPTGAAGTGAPLAKAADVPVGGGVVVADAAIVVTQPTAGDFKAFSAVCTHQGCLVGSVQNNEITCPCHGSVFSATDGSVISGPASAPLASAGVMVSGGNIVLRS